MSDMMTAYADMGRRIFAIAAPRGMVSVIDSAKLGTVNAITA